MRPTVESKIRSSHPNLEYHIGDDFIGVFDGLFSADYCRNSIRHFDRIDAAGMSYSRVQWANIPAHQIKDQAIDFNNCSYYAIDELRVESSEFNDNFWGACYPLYTEKYSILQGIDPHKIYTMKIQKIVPGGGYHTWHAEDTTRAYCSRILVFTLYLNDVNEGGETEFLYLGKRVQPKTGRLVVWPAGFTHTHRGNPPLKSNKYIITGWVEL